MINSLLRIWNLILRYFVENKYRELMYWCVLTFIFTIMDHRIFVIGVLFISGFIYTHRLKISTLQNENGRNFLLTPASATEKLIATILLNTFFHFGMILFTYAFGNLLITAIYQLLLKIDVPVNWDLFHTTNTMVVDGVIQASGHNVFWQLLGLSALSQAVLLAGALFFERYSTLKTLASIIATLGLLTVIQLILFKSLWDVRHLSNAILPTIIMLQNATLPPFVMLAFEYGSFLLLPFVWVISYFRLTEKEYN